MGRCFGLAKIYLTQYHSPSQKIVLTMEKWVKRAILYSLVILLVAGMSALLKESYS